MRRPLRNLGREMNIFNPIKKKKIYKKTPTTNFTFNGDRLNVFLLRSEQDKDVLCHHS